MTLAILFNFAKTMQRSETTASATSDTQGSDRRVSAVMETSFALAFLSGGPSVTAAFESPTLQLNRALIGLFAQSLTPDEYEHLEDVVGEMGKEMDEFGLSS